MKKLIIVLTVVLLIALAACSPQQPQEARPSEPEQTTKQMQIDARPPRPVEKEEQLKWLTCEFQHRQYLARKELEEQDLSDIMEINEDTELWNTRMALEVASDKKSKVNRVDVVEKTVPGPFKILEEKNGEVAAETYAQTVYHYSDVGGYSSAGISYTMKFKEVDGKYIITGCDTKDKGNAYLSLKSGIENYMKQGMSKSEANQKVYEDGMEQLRKQATTSTTT